MIGVSDSRRMVYVSGPNEGAEGSRRVFLDLRDCFASVQVSGPKIREGCNALGVVVFRGFGAERRRGPLEGVRVREAFLLVLGG